MNFGAESESPDGMAGGGWFGVILSHCGGSSLMPDFLGRIEELLAAESTSLNLPYDRSTLNFFGLIN
jgi:hypothetical protein